MEVSLNNHPDQTLVQNFLRGFVRVFVTDLLGTIQRRPAHEYSDTEFYQIKHKFLTEVDLGRLCGPFAELPDTGT